MSERRKMTLSKGSLIGFIMAILWLAGVFLSTQQCNWNPVCNGAAKGGFWCSIGVWIFFVPAFVGISVLNKVINIFGPVPPIIILIFVIILVLTFGILSGGIIWKLLHKSKVSV